MDDNTNWNALAAERRAVVDRIRAMSFDEAWTEVRAALEASPSLDADDRVLTVYEGPTRAFLLPLPFELLRDFIQHRGAQTADWLFSQSADAHPLVAAYSLHALSQLEDARLPEAAARVAERSERIRTIYGSFGWEGTLSAYGHKLHDEYVETCSQNRNP